MNDFKNFQTTPVSGKPPVDNRQTSSSGGGSSSDGGGGGGGGRRGLGLEVKTPASASSAWHGAGGDSHRRGKGAKQLAGTEVRVAQPPGTTTTENTSNNA